VHRLEDLPKEIQFLLAYPLYCSEPNGYPVAVLALASTTENSGLGVLIRPLAPDKPCSERSLEAVAAEPAGELAGRIYALWDEVFPSLLSLPQLPAPREVMNN
jgi:hypothetical protein